MVVPQQSNNGLAAPFATLFYAAGVLPVMVAAFFTASYVEGIFGCPSCNFAGLAGFVVFGLLVFVWFSVFALGFDRVRPSNLFDHLEHCALLYAGLVASAYVVATAGTHPESLEFALYAGLTLSILYAIVLNGLTLFVIRRRSTSR